MNREENISSTFYSFEKEKISHFVNNFLSLQIALALSKKLHSSLCCSLSSQIAPFVSLKHDQINDKRKNLSYQERNWSVKKKKG
ncbi:hypothetical protein P8452_04614 [Trifolium repens]|nr:hypothetical protein P8452_04614 [Trifolium repens]